jgi:hypothetical protein
MNAQQARRRREAAQARQADLQTGPPPWGVDTAGPNQRLQAIGLPPLSPMEGTVVWGVRFTPSCLGGSCAGGGRQLRVFVNGQPVRGDPTTLVLAPHQELVVALGTAAQLPSPVPSGYRFPPGL